MTLRGVLAGILMLLLTGCGQHEWVSGSASRTVTVGVAVTEPASEAAKQQPPPSDQETVAAQPPSPAPGATETSLSLPAPTELATAVQPLDTATSEEAPSDPAAGLWERQYAAVRITRKGAPQPFADGARPLLNPFRDRDGGDNVRWNGGCNTAGASVTITQTRFEVGDDAASTSAYCEPRERMTQEAWFSRFMQRDPAWQASEDATYLRLSHGVVVIDFKEHPWPPPWTADGVEQ